SVDDVSITLPHGRAADRGRIGARAGLRERERGGDLARGDAREVVALLLLGAGEEDGIAAQVLHEEDGRRRGAGPGDFLGRETEGQRARRAAPVLLGDVQPHEALLGEGRQLLLRVLTCLVDVRGPGSDPLARDVAGQIADRPLLVGEVEEILHGGRPGPEASAIYLCGYA